MTVNLSTKKRLLPDSAKTCTTLSHMRNSSWLLLVLMLIMSTVIRAQKIKINDSLRLNSEPMELKAKGISARYLKFRFGDYAVISGKAGWGSTKTTGKLFSVNEVSETKAKYSFVFASKSGDTASVNVATNTVIDIVDYKNIPFTTFGGADMSTIVGSKSNYFASIVNNHDSTVWTLVLVQTGGQTIDPAKAFSFKGALTDGNIKYDLKPVTDWENDKRPMMNFGLPGYEFEIDGRTVAAIQTPLNSMQKKYAWIDRRLDPSTQFLLATALTAIAENVVSEEYK